MTTSMHLHFLGILLLSAPATMLACGSSSPDDPLTSGTGGGGGAATGGSGGDGGSAVSSPMSVTVTNAGASPIYIDGILMPFALRNASGDLLPTSAGWGYHCDGCESVCETGAMGEVCPTYAEVPPGATVTVEWDRRVWAEEMSTCSCGGAIGEPACAVLSPAPQGPHDIELPYRTDLPGDESDYTNLPLEAHPHLDGAGVMIRSNCSEGFGLGVFDQVHSAPLPSVDAQAVDLTVTPAGP
jgi:hypothetical protein